jgi:hypothetical protein
MPDVTADLELLAGKVAERLVARALQQLASGATPMTITVHAEPPAQRLIGPGRKKPGPKPRAVELRGGRRAGKVAALATAGELARRCRKCTKLGTAKPLGDERAKCGSCGHEWTLRRSKFESASPAPQRRPTAKPVAGSCTRCDHPLSKHVEFSGACLAPRCVCAEAIE